MGQLFSNPEITSFEKVAQSEILQAEFNADDLSEQTNFSNEEIKFLYHIYYSNKQELLHSNEKTDKFLRSILNRQSFKNFILYLDGIIYVENYSSNSNFSIDNEPILSNEYDANQSIKEKLISLSLFYYFFSKNGKLNLDDIRNYMNIFENEEKLNEFFSFLKEGELLENSINYPQNSIENKQDNIIASFSNIFLGSKSFKINPLVHLQDLINDQKKLEINKKDSNLFRNYIKKANQRVESNRFVKGENTASNKNSNFLTLSISLLNIQDFFSILTDPIDILLNNESKVPSAQIEIFSEFQSKLLNLILLQKNLFLPIVKKIKNFLINFEKNECKLKGNLIVKEGNLAITTRWNSYNYKLQGGLLSQRTYLSGKKLNKNTKIVKSFVFLYGCRIEKMIFNEIDELKVTNKIKKDYKYKLKITQSRNQPEIYITTLNENDFENWYWSLLYFALHVQHNRFDGYYPVRYNINAMWFVNAKPLFERLADAIDAAKEEIYLTNWWTSPEVYLRRGEKPQLKDRFDQLLKKKAEQGVRIYMILWNETKVAQEGLMNRYAAQVFSNMHDHFRIMMHPVQEPISWAHHQKTIVIDQSHAFQGGIDVCWGRWDDRYHRIADPCHTRMEWPGKDYFNPLIQAIEDTYNPYFDTIDRTRQPRMPWHDIQMEMDGQAARDVALNFIERWNYSRQGLIDIEMNLANKLVIRKHYPILNLKSRQPETSNLNWYKDYYELPESRLMPRKQLDVENPTIEWKALQTDLNYHKNNLNTCKVQVLRSISLWSCASRTEASIYLAYLDMISKAQYYIFVENQYFCSSTAGHGVINRVAEAIVDRVRWAIVNNRKFRVFLIVPATPDGPLKDSSTVRSIQYYTLNSISRGGTSIIETLVKEFPKVNIGDYISTCSLRAHDEIDGVPVTEQVYVHAKTIIVDDKYALIGSANLNDRSFLGNRDSELAAIVEDSVKVKTTMNGEPYLADRFAFTFRMFLFREFLGLDEHDNSVLDPICDKTYKLWRDTANNNTSIYQQVFPDIPSDLIKSWKDLSDKDVELHISKPETIPLLKNIKGILINTPVNMLQDGSLAPHLFDYEQKVLNQYIFQ